MKYTTFSLFAVFFLVCSSLPAQNWKPVEGRIQTRWAAEVDPDQPWPEYPRPQLKRDRWQNLNGLWRYQITPLESGRPSDWAGDILVPYPLESALSGVGKSLDQQQELWYYRSFQVPKDWSEHRIRLHFGAVDWEAEIWVNGQRMGMHQGGYDPFSLDITPALRERGEQEVWVRVWDPSSEGTQPRGKQVTRPGGIWYTPVSGIWQTVWIEPVPELYITDLELSPDIDRNILAVQVHLNRDALDNTVIQLQASDGSGNNFQAGGQAGQIVEMPIPDAHWWSPDDPFLYDLTVTLLRDEEPIDEVDSYFGMRKFSIQEDERGFYRFQLNNEYIFPYGTLDQGWWPDGLYTAPTDEALKYDIATTKACGFNTIRKHVKVEPARWYYHCDKLGMLVWQDMPNGDEHASWRGPSGYDGREMERKAQSARQFMREWKAIIDANRKSPSIVMWVPFNEGWGQFQTEKVINWTMDYDTTRLVNGPSGGNFFPAGHTVDYHRYPGPGMADPREHAPVIMDGRAWLLGEFGGLGLPLEGHLWQADRNWGYRRYGTTEELRENYQDLIQKLIPLIGKGVAAAIYTQTTDVEGEINGLMTYDRDIVKMGAAYIKSVSNSLYAPQNRQ